MAWIVGTFIFFTVLVAVISWLKTRGDNLETAEGYFLAGRGLPGIVIAGSLLLTNLSAEQLVGVNGQTWFTNMSPMGFEVIAAIACLVLANFIAPRYLKSGVSTIPQMIGERYDRGTKLWFSIAYICLYIFIQIPVILYSGSLVFENIFGVSGMLGITKFQSIILICVLVGVIGSIYAIFGGLKAVAVSDTINGVGLIIGGFMIPFLGLVALGHAFGTGEGSALAQGLDYLLHAAPEKLNAIAPADSVPPAVPWPTILTGLLFLHLQSWCTHQSFVQRVLAAKNLKEAQKGAIFCAFLKIIGFMYLALPGIIAFFLLGDQVTMMDEAYPMLIARIVPAPVMGFFAAVMLGAILSSFNSVLNSIVTMFTLDIYRDFIHPEAADRKLVSIGKLVGTICAVASIAVSPFIFYAPQGLKTLLDEMVMLIALPVLSAVFGGFFFNRLPKYAAKFIFVFHIVMYTLFLITLGEEVHYLYAIAVLWPFEILLMYLMHRRNKAGEVYVQHDVGAVDLTPWKYRYVVSAVVIVLVIVVYAVFSPLGIAA
ncbi:solute:sodium symporter family transporter [Butyricicoccus faecihominis]|uniref:solute:sodium symporter family transporter n=1 Tax=Butyricicoccaceae TaxID=3085642 RepID=UPI002478B07F|nr:MULTISPECIES: solute:sodium symporter family transporter [Butyricicoccaceae]MCQ5128199.1 solute:sodium symporter family transporter [Butyricicoccus faecihominis]WNX86449.1 solute:sodium symporter family transporter [Agathobaculum sp. NTUH-O15-33]